MFYSLTVLHPRAKGFFQGDRDFEDFIAFVSQGARWKVLGAFALVGLSGIALVPLTAPNDVRWTALVGVKGLLFGVALVVFSYTSWRLWPRRIMAGTEEIPRLQRTFRRVGVTMLLLTGSAFALGILAHVSRG